MALYLDKLLFVGVDLTYLLLLGYLFAYDWPTRLFCLLWSISTGLPNRDKGALMLLKAAYWPSSPTKLFSLTDTLNTSSLSPNLSPPSLLLFDIPPYTTLTTSDSSKFLFFLIKGPLMSSLINDWLKFRSIFESLSYDGLRFRLIWGFDFKGYGRRCCYWLDFFACSSISVSFFSTFCMFLFFCN